MVKIFNKYIFFKLSLVLSLLTAVCCQKAPINGHLDGRWQIMEIEHQEKVENIADSQFYYNFYLHVCNLSYYGGVLSEANFIYKDNLIYLDFPYVETPEGLYNLTKYGIYSNPVEFEVMYLDKKKLIMRNDESLITLRKF